MTKADVREREHELADEWKKAFSGLVDGYGAPSRDVFNILIEETAGPFLKCMAAGSLPTGGVLQRMAAKKIQDQYAARIDERLSASWIDHDIPGTFEECREDAYEMLAHITYCINHKW